MVLDTFLNEKTSFTEGETNSKEKNCALFGTINIMSSMVEYIDERDLGRFLDPDIFITDLFVNISKHFDFSQAL